MKKLIAILLSLTLIFSLVGCKNETNSDEVTNEEVTDIADEASEIVDEVDADDTEIAETIEPEIFVYDQALQTAFDDFSEQVAIDSIAASPLNATFTYGDLESIGLGDLLYHLDDVSYEAMLESQAITEGELEELLSFDREALTKERQILFDMMKFYIEMDIESSRFYYYSSEFQPSSGVQVYLPISLMQIELEKESEVESYLNRLSEVPRFFDQEMDYTLTQASMGLLLPPSMYQDVIDQINEMLVEPENFMLYESFIDRIDALELDETTADTYKATCLATIENDIYPAYNRMIEGLEEVMTYTDTDEGISGWDLGQEYYALLLKSKTTYDMDIEDYRDLIIAQSTKYSIAIQTMLSRYPELMEMAFEELLPSFDSLDEVYSLQEACLDNEFYDYGIVNATENVIPSYLDDYLAAGFYFPITIDGEDYGNMYLGSDSYDNVDSSTLELYFHENMPGHHMYFDYLYNSDAPLFQKVVNNTAYAEGWATYVQAKAYEYVDLEDYIEELMFNIGMISQYNMAMMDIYIHVDGVTYDQSVEILINLGYPEDMAKETVNRLVANPGENIHYTYGNYKIYEYKDLIEEALGDTFDIKDFHDLILTNANTPFFIMDDIVDDYINGELESSLN